MVMTCFAHLEAVRAVVVVVVRAVAVFVELPLPPPCHVAGNAQIDAARRAGPRLEGLEEQEALFGR